LLKLKSFNLPILTPLFETWQKNDRKKFLSVHEQINREVSKAAQHSYVKTFENTHPKILFKKIIDDSPFLYFTISKNKYIADYWSFQKN
jgi:hypothetical protein